MKYVFIGNNLHSGNPGISNLVGDPTVEKLDPRLAQVTDLEFL